MGIVIICILVALSVMACCKVSGECSRGEEKKNGK